MFPLFLDLENFSEFNLIIKKDFRLFGNISLCLLEILRLIREKCDSIIWNVILCRGVFTLVFTYLFKSDSIAHYPFSWWLICFSFSRSPPVRSSDPRLSLLHLGGFSHIIFSWFIENIIDYFCAYDSLDTKFPVKTLEMIPSEHSETNRPDEIHCTHRQDIGKVSKWDSAILCIYIHFLSRERLKRRSRVNWFCFSLFF